MPLRQLSSQVKCETYHKKVKRFADMTNRSYICTRKMKTIMTKGEETRQFIIEKAAPIFNTKGIAATSMSDSMEATKLSKGIMYVHFDNKVVLA